ncbi:BppU family phage baseplate upper protein [Enterococcus faecium]|uniref:BppU family phage baseplate upper protein n=1 Tax=Enterococcus faecium TaxID=1352 RepID=UPI0015603F6A|nr:BppU family phage baseplate upper protein [Enterococcus faecium]NRE71055.1 BppU family phage baseplate upper protein [Enterococcus faecium]NTJ93205.1 BppU family phage baseplate upper protein [Enterococcus faecium]NTQ08212.1 BppU family phage baseplate upper protein [Enterococcus faecium]NTQ32615.1 BppU family phage baseplate upper protein [Enterococcus faecium]NTR03265.1 BppU family phage baseplate upper protein [Enterococcus faecium]
MVYKMNESIIVIQEEATKPNDTNVVFWSHDRGTAKLRMKLVRKNGIPQSLPEGTTVPIRLIFRSATAEDGYGKHDYLATIEDRVNGIVSIVLEDNILGYVGKVEGSVYIDFPDDRSLDTAGRFTFYIKRSPIDDSTPELEDYYFNGFSQTIDKIEKILADGKLEIEQKIAESETQIDAKVKDTNDKITKANQDVVTLNTNIDKAKERIDQTNQQIDDLGKLKKMYSNSIDFGDYDYSGNLNLMNNLSFSDFAVQSGAGTISDGGNFLKINKTSGTNLFVMAGYKNSAYYLTPVLPNTTYAITYVLRKSSNFVSQSGKRIFLRYRLNQNDVTNNLGELILDSTNVTAEFTTYTKTFTTGALVNPNSYYFQVLVEEGLSGEIELSYEIKLERGSTATLYQPNLLDDPYWVGKTSLGKNILKIDTVKFPIQNSEYMPAGFYLNEPYILGQTYTFTMKASKPATQTFGIYLRAGSLGAGNMTPLEGLTDVWQLTFKVTQAHIDGAANALNIFQLPQSTKGTVKIEWVKLEKGDIRTPNISQFKYFGEGLKDSNNPNDYRWDIMPEYTEKGLNDSVSLTEPQSVDGTKNFLETPLVNGKNVLVEEKPLPYEAWHSTGTEQTGISNKARLIIGPVATTIGAKLNRSMKENPLTWNSGNWQATANRDCTLLVEGLVRYQFGGSTAGQYGYITFYKDDAQTSSIGFAGGVGINGTALQWKHGLHFSRIFALKKGEYFNITFETQDGKKLDFSQINTLHIMEIES